MMDSPRGWATDSEDEEIRFLEGEKRTWRKGQTPQLSNPAETQDNDQQKMIRKLSMELSESKHNEKILVEELRRIKREYDKAVRRHERAMAANFKEKVPSEQRLSEKTETHSGKCDGNDEIEFDDMETFLRHEVGRLEDLLEETREERSEFEKQEARKARELGADLEEMEIKLSEVKTSETELKIQVEMKVKELNETQKKYQEIVQSQELMKSATKAELAESASRYETLQKISDEREKGYRQDIAELKHIIDVQQRKLEAETVRRKEERGKKEKDSYEQFKAYRELLKKNSSTTDSYSSLKKSILLILGDLIRNQADLDVESNRNSSKQECREQPILQGSETDCTNSDTTSEEEQRNDILQSISRLRADYTQECKLREAAERNFSICQKRLDRCLMKIQRLNHEVADLQAAQHEFSEMSVGDYERWFQEFKSMRKQVHNHSQSKPQLQGSSSLSRLRSKSLQIQQSITNGTGQKRLGTGSSGQQRVPENQSHKLTTVHWFPQIK